MNIDYNMSTARRYPPFLSRFQTWQCGVLKYKINCATPQLVRYLVVNYSGLDLDEDFYHSNKDLNSTGEIVQDHHSERELLVNIP